MENIYKEITLLIISHKSASNVKRIIEKINPNYKILIVENSLDESIREILSPLKYNIDIILSDNNGYGSAINLGRKKIETEYFFLFNPDVGNINDQVIEEIYCVAKKLKNNFCCIGPRFINLKKNIKQSDDKEDLAELSETARPDVDSSIGEETINEQGEVSLDEVSESENQESDLSAEDTDASNS